MSNRALFGFVSLIVILVTFTACEDEIINPKPPTFLKIEMPEHSYHIEKSDGPFRMEISDFFTFKNSKNCDTSYCQQEIYMGREINGNINLFYKKVSHIDSLGKLINFSNQEVDFHKIKADQIEYDQIIDAKNKVYGTLFELKGDVATNFQFYLTDSLDNFLRGEVILNCVPNYDSLRHVLNYIKLDLTHMINTFEWLND